ncbi:uncharacterized protein METZ01_LOCUS232842, partial [marine metagenome]
VVEIVGILEVKLSSRTDFFKKFLRLYLMLTKPEDICLE